MSVAQEFRAKRLAFEAEHGRRPIRCRMAMDVYERMIEEERAHAARIEANGSMGMELDASIATRPGAIEFEASAQLPAGTLEFE